MYPGVYYLIIRAEVLTCKATSVPQVQHMEAQYQPNYIIEQSAAENDYIIKY